MKMKMTFNTKVTRPVKGEVGKEPESEVDEKLRDAVREVRDEYDGETREEVRDKIIARAKEKLGPDLSAGLRPDPRKVMKIAEAITKGEFRD